MDDGTALARLWAEHPAGHFILRRLPDYPADTPPYAVWLPHDAPTRVRRPVILALHGSGERGRDGRRQTRVGLGPVLPDLSPPCAALVVFPQAAPDEDWHGAAAQRAWMALEATIAEFGGDPQCVALTGLSLGGTGAWLMALAAPQRFVRLAVICGRLEPQQLSADLQAAAEPYRAAAERLRDLPVRVFHGAEDPVVPVLNARRMVSALGAVGADVRYTEYPAGNHGAWVQAYREPGLVAWLSGWSPPAAGVVAIGGCGTR
ncbi:MAG TPA: alpha/beta hydrolase-fold protein [Nevskiaceae bacterium]|nr:alpha/beta hydrolase-fold protein [Nevskiaceae bacterium]